MNTISHSDNPIQFNPNEKLENFCEQYEIENPEITNENEHNSDKGDLSIFFTQSEIMCLLYDEMIHFAMNDYTENRDNFDTSCLMELHHFYWIDRFLDILLERNSFLKIKFMQEVLNFEIGKYFCGDFESDECDEGKVRLYSLEIGEKSMRLIDLERNSLSSIPGPKKLKLKLRKFY